MPNVMCKVSGMVTEAAWRGWSSLDFRPYLDVVFDAFGVDRVMYGSDWPVCLAAAEYAEVVGLVRDYVQEQYPDAMDKIFGLNAAAFYQRREPR